MTTEAFTTSARPGDTLCAGETPIARYEHVARAIRFIRAQRQAQPTLDDTAAALGLSASHLQRIFSAWAGVSPKRFLQALTRREAIAALRSSASVLDASLAVGLSGPGRLHDLTISCDALTPGEIASGGAGLTLEHGWGETPFGWMLACWHGRGICHLGFHDAREERRVEALQGDWPGARHKAHDDGAQTLADRLFPAEPLPGRLHLLLRGTNFQIKVWEALLRVPEASLVSYGRLAQAAGASGAARSVGSAVAANRIALLIPCHRVIRESGDFGDYRWGAERKMALHGWEQARAHPADNSVDDINEKGATAPQT